MHGGSPKSGSAKPAPFCGGWVEVALATLVCSEVAEHLLDVFGGLTNENISSPESQRKKARVGGGGACSCASSSCHSSLDSRVSDSDLPLDITELAELVSGA